MKMDWNQSGLERLFGQIDEECPVDNPLVIDCSERDRTTVLLQVIAALRDRLRDAGFFAESELCLIVPTGVLPDDLAGHIDVYESDACDDTAYLFTVRVGGHNIISLSRDPVTDEPMSSWQWACRVLRGEKIPFVNTMPWAHAKFINWKEKDMNQRELRRKVEEGLRELIEERKVYQRKPWTFVLLRILMPGGELEEIFDFAKVVYPDKWDPGRGAELAEQKAIAAFAKKLLLEEQEWIKNLSMP